MPSKTPYSFSHRQRGLVPILRLITVASLLVIFVGCTQKESVWETSDEVQSQLDERTQLEGYAEYSIRPPLGYTLNDSMPGDSNTTFFVWKGPSTDHGGGLSTSASFTVKMQTLDPTAYPAQASWDGPTVLEMQLERSRKHSNWKESELTSRQSDGIEWFHKDFSYEHDRFGPQKAFIYTAVNEGVAISMYGSELQGAATPELLIARASAMTFAYRPANP